MISFDWTQANATLGTFTPISVVLDRTMIIEPASKTPTKPEANVNIGAILNSRIRVHAIETKQLNNRILRLADIHA